MLSGSLVEIEHTLNIHPLMRVTYPRTLTSLLRFPTSKNLFYRVRKCGTGKTCKHKVLVFSFNNQLTIIRLVNSSVGIYKRVGEVYIYIYIERERDFRNKTMYANCDLGLEHTFKNGLTS